MEVRSFTGMLQALLHALNPMDLIRGIRYALSFRTHPHKTSV